MDAVFGTGLNRMLSDEYHKLFEEVSGLKGIKVALDIPSGMSAEGVIFSPHIFEADITYSFGFLKLAHVLYPGAAHCGKVVKLDMGVDERSISGAPPKFKRAESMADFEWPKRYRGANKGTYKKLAVIAGSKDIWGAALLCTGGAFAAGVGMVTVITHVNNGEHFAANYPEAMIKTYSDETEPDKLREIFDTVSNWADGIVLGPGIGRGNQAELLTGMALGASEIPLLIDADGINIIADKPELLELLKKRQSRKLILTPHIKEFARLTDMKTSDISAGLTRLPKEYADKFNCTIICKDAASVISSCEEEISYINTSGNEGMASAGSGDVLAGICAVLMLQMENFHEAAAAAAYIHGAAGGLAASEKGTRAMLAGDIINKLKDLWI